LAPSATACDVADNYAEQPEIPEPDRSIPLHEQVLDPFEPKACVARTKVVFTPRHVLVPEIFVRHGALLRGFECSP
jgi:hypothetical protein